MTQDLNAFEKSLKRFTRETLPKAVTEAQREIAREVLRGVVARTPVKTGRTRGNWQVTLDGPADGVLEVRDPSGATTVARGLAVIASSEPFGSIWITNNRPGVETLEHGSLDQAPTAMVSATVASLMTKGNRGGGA